MNKGHETYRAIFGEDYQRESYKLVPHTFRAGVVGKSYCTGCGLIALNNKFTSWAVSKGCLAELHPQYKQTRKKLTGLRV